MFFKPLNLYNLSFSNRKQTMLFHTSLPSHMLLPNAIPYTCLSGQSLLIFQFYFKHPTRASNPDRDAFLLSWAAVVLCIYPYWYNYSCIRCLLNICHIWDQGIWNYSGSAERPSLTITSEVAPPPSITLYLLNRINFLHSTSHFVALYLAFISLFSCLLFTSTTIMYIPQKQGL